METVNLLQDFFSLQLLVTEIADKERERSCFIYLNYISLSVNTKISL